MGLYAVIADRFEQNESLDMHSLYATSKVDSSSEIDSYYKELKDKGYLEEFSL